MQRLSAEIRSEATGLRQQLRVVQQLSGAQSPVAPFPTSANWCQLHTMLGKSMGRSGLALGPRCSLSIHGLTAWAWHAMADAPASGRSSLPKPWSLVSGPPFSPDADRGLVMHPD